MKMREGFSMVTAIFVIVIMATISAFILSLSGKITQVTTEEYRHAQAALLARSYTELAIMSVMDHNRSSATNECIEDIDGIVTSLIPGTPAPATATTANGQGYKVETRIYYLGNNLPCSESRKLNDSSTYSNTLIASDYNNTGAADALAAIIVDVTVQYKNPDDLNQWISYHTRSLQKI